MNYRIGDRVYPIDIDFIQNIIRYEKDFDFHDIVGIVVYYDNFTEEHTVKWLNTNRTRIIDFQHVSRNNSWYYGEMTDSRKYFLDVVSDAKVGLKKSNSNDNN